MRKLASILSLMLAILVACGGGGDAEGKAVLVGNRGAGGGNGNLEVGANLSGMIYFDVTPIFTNLVRQGRGLNSPGTLDTHIAVDANECPNADFTVGTQFLPALTANADVTFEITGDFASASIDFGQTGDSLTSTGTYDVPTNTRQVIYHMTSGRPAASLWLRLTGTKKSSGGTPGEGVAGIIAARPGYTISQIKTQKYTTEWTDSLAGVKVLRFMDLQAINGTQNFGQGADFTTRPRSGPCATAVTYRENMADPSVAHAVGLSLEDIADIGNTLGKDVWVNIPAKATDAYVTSFVTTLHGLLNSDKKVYLEWVNEPWNSAGGFDQWSYIMNLAAIEVNGWYGFNVFQQPVTTRAILSATCSGGNTITINTQSAHSYAGTGITVSGINGDSYTSRTATSVDATDFSYTVGSCTNGAISISGASSILETGTTSNLVVGPGSALDVITAKTMLVIRRAKEISVLTRAVVGDGNMMTRYRPIYAWQGSFLGAVGDYWPQLSWLDSTFNAQHPVSYYLWGITGAPYWTLDASPYGGANLQTDSATHTVAEYLAALALTSANQKNWVGMEAKAVAALHFGIENVAYEGGSWSDGDKGATNNATFNSVNLDPTIKTYTKNVITDFINYGTKNPLYVQYRHQVVPGNDTNWFWSTDDLSTHPQSAKIMALREMGQAARPTPTRHVGLGTFDCRERSGKYLDLLPNLLTSDPFPGWGNGSDGLENASHAQLSTLWWETGAGGTRSISFNYTNNEAGWTIHVWVNGVDVGTQNLSNSPADLTTVKSSSTFTFTSKAGPNALEFVRTAGSQGAAKTQCRNWTIS